MRTGAETKRVGDALIMKASMQTLRGRFASNPKLGVKLLRSIGSEFGVEMAQKMGAKSLDGIVEELAYYWGQNEIGQIGWVDKKSRVIKVEEYERSVEGRGTSDTNRHLCPFKKGYLEALLRTKLGESFNVKELHSNIIVCHCVFRITQNR